MWCHVGYGPRGPYGMVVCICGGVGGHSHVTPRIGSGQPAASLPLPRRARGCILVLTFCYDPRYYIFLS
jgi:hypothetical protein